MPKKKTTELFSMAPCTPTLKSTIRSLTGEVGRLRTECARIRKIETAERDELHATRSAFIAVVAMIDDCEPRLQAARASACKEIARLHLVAEVVEAADQ